MRLFSLLCALVAKTMVAATDTQVALKAVTESAEQFSTNFFKIVEKKEKGNLITSPLSADIVLSMAAYGARENTAKEMRDVLKLPADDALAKSGFQNLIDTLNNVTEVDFKLANKIFTSHRHTVNPEFKALTADTFRSAEEQVDFAQATAAASTINSWCEKQTNNKIKDIIKADDLSADTAMVLVNAVYFKGEWKYKFDANQTTDKPFHVDAKTIKNVPTMYQRFEINYGVLPELKAKFVEIPYKGDEMSMIIILPDEINGLQEVEQKLETLSLQTIIQEGFLHDIELYLPKFKIESSIQLNDVLQEMGMQEMFTDKANFSGIAEGNLKVSKVVQKAFIEVNEVGSEAAAATGYTFENRIGSRPETKIQFIVNRPFFYILTGNIIYMDLQFNLVFYELSLFNGHVMEPKF